MSIAGNTGKPALSGTIPRLLGRNSAVRTVIPRPARTPPHNPARLGVVMASRQGRRARDSASIPMSRKKHGLSKTANGTAGSLGGRFNPFRAEDVTAGAAPVAGPTQAAGTLAIL